MRQTKKALLHRITAALLLAISLLSFASCSGSKVQATLDDAGVLTFKDVRYTPVDTAKFTELMYDTYEVVGEVAEHANLSVYNLRYSDNEEFLCLAAKSGERTLFVAESHELWRGGKFTTNILLRHQNGFTRKVADEADFSTMMSLDTLRGEQVSFTLDPESDVWASIYAAYDGRAVATAWFGTLVQQKDGRLLYVTPTEKTRTLMQDAPGTYQATVISDAEQLKTLKRITGLG